MLGSGKTGRLLLAVLVAAALGLLAAHTARAQTELAAVPAPATATSAYCAKIRADGYRVTMSVKDTRLGKPIVIRMVSGVTTAQHRKTAPLYFFVYDSKMINKRAPGLEGPWVQTITTTFVMHTRGVLTITVSLNRDGCIDTRTKKIRIR